MQGKIRFDFDRRLRVKFKAEMVSSDGGLLLYREFDERLGLGDIAQEVLKDTRTGTNSQYSLIGLLRQSVYSRLAGYEDVNDADRMVCEFERDETVRDRNSDNLAALDALPGHWIDRVHECNRKPLKLITLDMDSSFSPTYGKQEGTAFNKYYGGHGYHPLFLFNQLGHLECSSLRPGNVGSAHGWEKDLDPVIKRYEHRELQRFFRGDAGFAIPKLYEKLEATGFSYTIRLRKNSILNKLVASMLTRPEGSSSTGALGIYRSFQYQAGSWDKPRRVEVKLEWDEGKMFARPSFIVTNMKQNPKYITNFYNKRGTAEQYIKEGKHAINWTRLSYLSMRANEVRLKLHALAYNLGVFLKVCPLPKEIRAWSLTSLQKRVIKTGARIVRHARTITFQLAEVAVVKASFTVS